MMKDIHCTQNREESETKEDVLGSVGSEQEGRL